jgi:hypothetical protein
MEVCMKKALTLRFTLIMLLLAASMSIAQSGRGLNQCLMTRLYDVAKETKIEGMLSNVTADTGYGRYPGMIADMRTSADTLKAYIAPEWYMKHKSITIKKDQHVIVTGSKVTYNNKALIIVRSIEYKDSKLVIRDDRGIPVWSGKSIGPGYGRGQGRRNRIK